MSRVFLYGTNLSGYSWLWSVHHSVIWNVNRSRLDNRRAPCLLFAVFNAALVRCHNWIPDLVSLNTLQLFRESATTYFGCKHDLGGTTWELNLWTAWSYRCLVPGSGSTYCGVRRRWGNTKTLNSPWDANAETIKLQMMSLCICALTVFYVFTMRHPATEALSPAAAWA